MNSLAASKQRYISAEPVLTLIPPLLLPHLRGQEMITYAVMERVFRLGFKTAQGTTFAIESGGRQYLVTAAHNIEGIKDSDEIQIWRNGSWNSLTVNVCGIDYGNDIAVLAPPTQLCHAYGVATGVKGISPGHELYFLGFPFGLHTQSVVPSGLPNLRYPLPYVKRSILSAMPNEEIRSDFILDGYNNEGFSGGPVVYQLPSDTRIYNNVIYRDFRIAAVVSGFIMEDQPVEIDGRPLKATVKANSGLIRCTSITRALDMIKAKPVGAQTSTSEGPFQHHDVERLSWLRQQGKDLAVRYGAEWNAQAGENPLTGLTE